MEGKQTQEYQPTGRWKWHPPGSRMPLQHRDLSRLGCQPRGQECHSRLGIEEWGSVTVSLTGQEKGEVSPQTGEQPQVESLQLSQEQFST